ncbi:MAG TPA: NAD(P)H-dependent oxidoreductase [Candidatus Eisenbergiella merdipullorum]|uniref:NAD(P)H-dependent oxidoreductase n=1 Tax=Candidatus Eisenbergiella merdipullorum TaxID=2838553 RepID=A0A9D2I5L9_9FIRM|nr:NAD(P)H-dependent oxidoreductase [Candidatus Eisenbergiella merdipullorum]
MSNILIVYFSRKGENYWNGSIRNLRKGNTEIVAEMIADLTGGDLFEVETVKPYPEEYYACTDEAKEELREKARPELKAYPDSLDGYDTIYVGYPNWWGTMPMAMFAFLEHYDWSGKRILPFCTNEGSGMGGSERDLKNVCTGAVVERGLSIHGAEAADSGKKVEAWVKEEA